MKWSNIPRTAIMCFLFALYSACFPLLAKAVEGYNDHTVFDVSQKNVLHDDQFLLLTVPALKDEHRVFLLCKNKHRILSRRELENPNICKPAFVDNRGAPLEVNFSNSQAQMKKGCFARAKDYLLSTVETGVAAGCALFVGVPVGGTIVLIAGTYSNQAIAVTGELAGVALGLSFAPLVIFSERIQGRSARKSYSDEFMRRLLSQHKLSFPSPECSADVFKSVDQIARHMNWIVNAEAVAPAKFLL